MAEKTEYLITIKLDGVDEEEGVKTAPHADGTPGASKPHKLSDSKIITGAALYGFAKKAVFSIVDQRIQTINLRTGHGQYQERAEFARSMITQAYSLGESFVVGTIISGNPIGGLVATALTVATTAINTAIEYEKYEMRKSVSDIGRAQANIRAASGSGRR